MLFEVDYSKNFVDPLEINGENFKKDLNVSEKMFFNIVLLIPHTIEDLKLKKDQSLLTIVFIEKTVIGEHLPSILRDLRLE